MTQDRAKLGPALICEESSLRQFTLFWRTGDREVIEGQNVADAIRRRGYGHGAISVLDFWKPGDDAGYEWLSDRGRWSAVPRHDGRPASE